MIVYAPATSTHATQHRTTAKQGEQWEACSLQLIAGDMRSRRWKARCLQEAVLASQTLNGATRKLLKDPLVEVFRFAVGFSESEKDVLTRGQKPMSIRKTSRELQPLLERGANVITIILVSGQIRSRRHPLQRNQQQHNNRPNAKLPVIHTAELRHDIPALLFPPTNPC